VKTFSVGMRSNAIWPKSATTESTTMAMAMAMLTVTTRNAGRVLIVSILRFAVTALTTTQMEIPTVTMLFVDIGCRVFREKTAKTESTTMETGISTAPSIGIVGSSVLLASTTTETATSIVTDARCQNTQTCNPRELCADDVDNDSDGDIDCADSDCELTFLCRPQEVCGDGLDNDDDGDADCDDRDCWSVPGCREDEVCDDGIDNDRDSRIDCADIDCWYVASCPFRPTPNGGVYERFCSNAECVRAGLSVFFPTGSAWSAVPSLGSDFEIRVVAELDVDGIDGWSFVVEHDPEKLRLLEVSGNQVPGSREDVISTFESRFTVVGESRGEGHDLSTDAFHVLARARYRVLDNPSGTRIEFVEQAPDSVVAPLRPDFVRFVGACLKRANLHGAVFHGADSRRVDLRGADLRGASLTNPSSMASAELEESRSVTER
jgi:hypothetical protein